MNPAFLNPLNLGLIFGLKTLRYFIDNYFRDKVVPRPGSVVYCDLWVAVEHSGIYLGDGDISNIEVDGVAEAVVARSGARSFTSKSTMGRKIYVSCDGQGAVGDEAVATKAASHIGERNFYGLFFANCHAFSTKCVNHSSSIAANAFFDRFSDLPSGEWELTLGRLKETARKRLGATKWRLWDWEADGVEDHPEEPDWQAHNEHFRHQKLDARTIEQIRSELANTRDYEAEIADENIPLHIRERLATFRNTLDAISQKYDEVSTFLALNPDASFSYADLMSCSEDFSALTATMRDNVRIQELVRKLGRDYISEEKKKRRKIPQASKTEVHGTHRSDDLMRMLPSELLNLEDDALESLFYARLLEQNLLSYELQGKHDAFGEDIEHHTKHTGPVVACLDTSASMHGSPLVKAKALLLAISNILKSEGRSLHILLFGAKGELREFSMTAAHDVPGLLSFLNQGYGGGTDFETPLQRAFAIIASQERYKKADVLMISDGDCCLSSEFIANMTLQKEKLDCMVYSVLCAGSRVEDSFSDSVLVL